MFAKVLVPGDAANPCVDGCSVGWLPKSGNCYGRGIVPAVGYCDVGVTPG